MTAPSKTVCLRAFNEDLGGVNPWERQGPTPPPLPKRIAWPGGKIVSNKDEALASFLRRKLDQGQKLTPEQMAMLEKMVDPNASVATAPAATAGGKRKNRWSGNGSGGVGASRADARGLLHKLERKVATAPSPLKPANGNGRSITNGGGGGGGRIQGRAVSAKRGSRTKVLDLSSLKHGGARLRSGNNNNNNNIDSGSGGGAGGRRIIPDGQGGFTIATATPQVIDVEDFDDDATGSTTVIVSRQPQKVSSKRLRGDGGARLDVAASPWSGGGGAVVEPVPEAACAAAVVATIPAVYLEAGVSNAARKKGGKVVAQGAVRGKRTAGQQRLKGRGQGGGMAKAVSKAGGLTPVNRSLEELMSGGLAACRR